MHLNGELEPLVLIELFSIFSDVGAVDVEFDISVFTSRNMDSRLLYC